MRVHGGDVVMGRNTTHALRGIIGTRYARFSDFVHRPATAMVYLIYRVARSGKRYIGHNPAGGLMIIALLFTLVITSLSGLVAYGADEQALPWAGLLTGSSGTVIDFFGEVREAAVYATITLGRGK